MDMDRLITNSNSCSFDNKKFKRGQQFGISVKIIFDSLHVKVKEGGWKNCIKNGVLYPDVDLTYFAIVSNNQNKPYRVSNIDIESI